MILRGEMVPEEGIEPTLAVKRTRFRVLSVGHTESSERSAHGLAERLTT